MTNESGQRFFADWRSSPRCNKVRSQRAEGRRRKYSPRHARSSSKVATGRVDALRDTLQRVDRGLLPMVGLPRDRTSASALCLHFTLHSSVPAPYYATVPVGLARRLGPFDATMIVMGGIIGSGIFINPYVVARQVHTPLLILGVGVAGGAGAVLR